ncbi:zinc finger and BTB domain-containing protein 5 [Grus japonensis]|uniref:Zinc finger and BTB domain-containing protein 5 n=1 Tax=Grus japonensis TaxID=30415 RepID=A0ABC9WA44_GRUJA
MEDPTPEQVEAPEGGCGLWEAHAGASSWQDLWTHGERSPRQGRFAGRTCDPVGDPTLEQFAPEGLHPVGETHIGAVCEGLSPPEDQKTIVQQHRQPSVDNQKAPTAEEACWRDAFVTLKSDFTELEKKLDDTKKELEEVHADLVMVMQELDLARAEHVQIPLSSSPALNSTDLSPQFGVI